MAAGPLAARPRRAGFDGARPLLPVVLCLLLGSAAFADEPRRGEDPLVARVNGLELRLSHVYASIESLPPSDQLDARDQLNTYIEAIIGEEILFQWVLRSNFAGYAALRQDVKERVVQHVIELHVRSRLRVTEADARAYYDAHPSRVRGEHIRVRRILLSERAQCERLRAELDSEASFAEAARRHSLDTATARNSGDLGFVMRSEEPTTSDERHFFEMEVGEMRIFDVPQGCSLVRLVAHVNPPLPPFPDVRDELMQYLRRQQELVLVEGLFQQATQHVKVERFQRQGLPLAAPLPHDAPTPAAAPVERAAR